MFSPVTGAAPTPPRPRSPTAGSAPAISPRAPTTATNTLLGRKSDLIISGGFNIYPREIEELLLEQPSVAEAAVVGVPDELRGEVPVAFIVPVDTFDESALERCCREQLASFKIPRRFVRVDSISRTALGKVQKHLLPRPPT